MGTAQKLLSLELGKVAAADEDFYPKQEKHWVERNWLADLLVRLEKLPYLRLNCFAELVFQGDGCRDGGSVVGRRDLNGTAIMTVSLLVSA